MTTFSPNVVVSVQTFITHMLNLLEKPEVKNDQSLFDLFGKKLDMLIRCPPSDSLKDKDLEFYQWSQQLLSEGKVRDFVAQKLKQIAEIKPINEGNTQSSNSNWDNQVSSQAKKNKRKFMPEKEYNPTLPSLSNEENTRPNPNQNDTRYQSTLERPNEGNTQLNPTQSGGISPRDKQDSNTYQGVLDRPFNEGNIQPNSNQNNQVSSQAKKNKQNFLPKEEYIVLTTLSNKGNNQPNPTQSVGVPPKKNQIPANYSNVPPPSNLGNAQPNPNQNVSIPPKKNQIPANYSNVPPPSNLGNAQPNPDPSGGVLPRNNQIPANYSNLPSLSNGGNSQPNPNQNKPVSSTYENLFDSMDRK